MTNLDWINLWILGPAAGFGIILLLSFLFAISYPRFRTPSNLSFLLFNICLLIANLLLIYLIFNLVSSLNQGLPTIEDPAGKVFSAFTLSTLLTSFTYYIFIKVEFTNEDNYPRLIGFALGAIFFLAVLASTGIFDIFPLYHQTLPSAVLTATYILSIGYFTAALFLYYRHNSQKFLFFGLAPIILIIGLGLTPLFLWNMMVSSLSIFITLLGLITTTIFEALIRPTYENIVRVESLNQELVEAYNTTLEGWARALELRDKETESHSRRVTQMAVELAKAINLPDDELIHVRYGALLHDIGKMALPDDILKKPGSLNQEERAIVEKHPLHAWDLLKDIQFLEKAANIPRYHHEKWDGSGYPYGLSGEDIPLYARLFTIVDVWDAITSNRPYCDAWSVEKARQYLVDESGRFFDPDILAVFLSRVVVEK